MADSERPQAPDALSPTTLVLNYLQSKGMQPSSENVRRALEANQRDNTTIPGLINDRPATDAEDQAAMAASRGRGGPPVGAIPTNQPQGVETSAPPAAQTSTQTEPQYDRLGMLAALVPSLASAILGGRSPALPGQENLGPGPRMPSTGRVTDVNPTGVTGTEPPQLDAAITKALEPPRTAIAGPAPTPAPTPAPNVPFNSPSPRRPPTPEEIAALAKLRPAGASVRPMGAFKFMRAP